MPLETTSLPSIWLSLAAVSVASVTLPPSQAQAQTRTETRRGTVVQS
jgi:hypothetical protein